MPDYMYLLESRLSPEQRAVMERVQELARAQDLNVYLTGGAVRDLISGMPIRDLDFTVEGNPAKMVRELEKGGASLIWESDKIRHHEVIFSGDVDGSISAAREDHYERPGVKPEYRFSSIMEDLKRRDIGINAIAISLNTQSRGLLLDPMNGLADLEKQEIRVLSIHAFTNQPIRLMRTLRYAARMDFKMEPRTQEWFDLAMERGLIERIETSDVGHELRSMARDDNPSATLKQWESHEMLELIHPALQKRKPDYDSLNKLARVRSNLYGYGLRPRLHLAVTYYTLGRLKDREAASALRNMEYRAAEIDALGKLVPETQKVVKVLKSPKTNAAKDALLLSRLVARRSSGLHRSRDAQSARAFQDSQLPAEVAPAAHGYTRRRTRSARRRTRPEIRQDRRPVLRIAIARQRQDTRRPHQDFEESRRHQGRAQKARKS